MKDYKLLIALGVIFLSFLTGCAAIKSTVKRINIVNCEYRFAGVSPSLEVAFPLKRSSLDIDLRVGVKNPNETAVTFDRMEYDFYIDKQKIFTGIKDRKVSIEAGKEEIIHLSVNPTYEDLKKGFTKAVEAVRSGGATLKLKGFAFFETPVGRMKFPVKTLKKKIN